MKQLGYMQRKGMRLRRRSPRFFGERNAGGSPYAVRPPNSLSPVGDSCQQELREKEVPSDYLDFSILYVKSLITISCKDFSF